jgi:hypothetical protein
MRRVITTILAGSLIVGAFVAPAAEAAKKKKKVKTRKVSVEYTAPSASVEGNGLCDPGCVHIPTMPSEKFAQFSVTDTTGLPVSVSITVPDQNGDGFVENIASFCGESGKVPIPGGNELTLFIYGHPTVGAFESVGGPTACNGVGTSGTIDATITNR